MTYEELIAVARKKPDTIWIPPSSVRTVAIGFQGLCREPSSLSSIERGINEGTMNVYGVPVRVYEIV